MTDYTSAHEFYSEISSNDMTPPNNIEPGEFVRFPGVGKKGSNKSGWARLFDDGLGGVYGDWSTGFYAVWRSNSKNNTTLSQSEINARKLQREAQQATKYKKAASEVAQLIASTQPADPNHPYLVNKNVSSHGIHESSYRLLIPVFNIDGAAISAQYIEADGTKRFHPGGRVKGGFYPIGFQIGDCIDLLVIAEGFGTASTIYQATNYPTVVAFNCGNLEPVAVAFRGRYPDLKIIIGADDDARY